MAWKAIALQLLTVVLALHASTTATGCCQTGSNSVPIEPVGTAQAQVLLSGSSRTIASEAGPLQTACCPRGRVRKWLTAKTRRNGYIGQLGIVCSEESVVPALPVTYGFNGTNADTCDIDLLEQKFTQNPEDNIFYYSSGLILDAFLGSGTPNKPTSKAFSCDNGKIAVGFSARSNCYALTSFQVICADAERTIPAFPPPPSYLTELPTPSRGFIQSQPPLSYISPPPQAYPPPAGLVPPPPDAKSLYTPCTQTPPIASG